MIVLEGKINKTEIIKSLFSIFNADDCVFVDKVGVLGKFIKHINYINMYMFSNTQIIEWAKVALNKYPNKNMIFVFDVDCSEEELFEYYKTVEELGLEDMCIVSVSNNDIDECIIYEI